MATTNTQTHNIDSAEVEKFNALASRWWDPNGEMKPLHLLNPTRLAYIQQHATLANQHVLDLGCGAGLLSEAMAKVEANVDAIDVSPKVIEIAKQHASQQNLTINYQQTSIESLIESNPEPFDVITCMEMLEHVPEPLEIIQSCADLLKPGGMLFLSTINRNLKAYLGAVIGAEYILGLLPKGTHEYAKFIRPAELNRWATAAKLQFKHLQGVSYNPLNGEFKLSKDVDINYMISYIKTA